MVKGMVWAATALAMIGSILVGVRMINADSGRLLGIAVSPADAQGRAQVQVIVTLLMDAEDPPRPKRDSTQPDWDAWLDTHLDLRDAAGQKIAFRKGGFKTDQITEAQSGTAEFIALATITAGQPHTLNVTPRLGEPEKYRLDLDGHELPFRRTNFEPNY